MLISCNIVITSLSRGTPPPSHAGSGSKQTHVVNSEPIGSRSKYCIISTYKHRLTMKNKYVIWSHINFMISLFGSIKT